MNNSDLDNTQDIERAEVGQEIIDKDVVSKIMGQDGSGLPGAENYAPALREEVALIFKRYFDNLEGETITDFYQLFLSEFEPALFEAVMKFTRGNQTKAAAILSVNRGTLRKKLKVYGML